MKQLSAIVFLTMIVLCSCRKEKFTSESNWITPILETELSLGDIVPDSLSRTNSDNSTDIVYETSYGVSSVSDIVQIPDTVEVSEVSLSSLTLDDRSFIDTLTLLELYPASALFHNQTTTLPGQDIQTEEGTVVDVTEEFFTTATFVSGFIDITIFNDLPVVAEVLEFELRNDDDKSVIVNGVFNNLQPNSSVSDSYSLADKKVNGILELIVKRVKTLDSDGPVLVDVYKGIRTEIAVRDLKPKSATAIFPAQNLIDKKDEIEYYFGGAEFTQVKLKSGFIKLKVESTVEEAIVLDYSLPNSFKDGEPGTPLSKTWTVPPAKRGEKIFVEEMFPIGGYTIYFWGKSNLENPTFNHVYTELIARIEYSGILRTLSLEDKIRVELGLVDLIPELIIGDPGRHELSSNDTVGLKLFDNISGDLSLEDAKMNLNFYNSFGIETLLDIKEIKGQNTRNGKSLKLISSELLNPILLKKAVNNPPLVAYEYDVMLDKSNSNLKQFLELMPNKLMPEIEAVVRPNGTINQNDFAFDVSELLVNIRFEMPLKFGLDNLTVAVNESVTFFSDEKVDNIKGGQLILKLINDFPISGRIKMVFKDKMGEQLFELFSGDNYEMTAAEVDPQTNKTKSPTESELIANISRDQAKQLSQIKSIDLEVYLNTEDAKRHLMFSDYTINAKLISDFIYENNL
ncbi:MAG: hypothetical protein VW147_00445 [Bacteroidota bacterium]